jgi:hypothetical protein
MNILPAQTITAAVTGVTPGPVVKFNAPPRSLTCQVNFVYGSGGTNATVYLQTSLDGGTTWSDIAALQFTTSNGRKAVNVTSRTPVTTPAALTDGSLTANTSQDGVLGSQWRAKLTTTGTYGGGTTITADIQSEQAGA